MRELDRHRHELGCLCAGIAKHHPLISGTYSLDLCIGHLTLFGLSGFVHAHGDVRRLLLDGRDHATGKAVKARGGTVIADLADRLTHDLGYVDIALGRDLACIQHQACRDGCLTRDTAVGVLVEDGIENRVRDEIAHLIRVSLSD